MKSFDELKDFWKALPETNRFEDVFESGCDEHGLARRQMAQAQAILDYWANEERRVLEKLERDVEHLAALEFGPAVIEAARRESAPDREQLKLGLPPSGIEIREALLVALGEDEGRPQ